MADEPKDLHGFPLPIEEGWREGESANSDLGEALRKKVIETEDLERMVCAGTLPDGLVEALRNGTITPIDPADPNTKGFIIQGPEK